MERKGENLFNVSHNDAMDLINRVLSWIPGLCRSSIQFYNALQKEVCRHLNLIQGQLISPVLLRFVHVLSGLFQQIKYNNTRKNFGDFIISLVYQ